MIGKELNKNFEACGIIKKYLLVFFFFSLHELLFCLLCESHDHVALFMDWFIIVPNFKQPLPSPSLC